jgi:hypothetical protein
MNNNSKGKGNLLIDNLVDALSSRCPCALVGDVYCSRLILDQAKAKAQAHMTGPSMGNP